MAQGRSVRFLPNGLEDSLDPAPVFSPTQLDTHTSVLHSVFSPSARAKEPGFFEGGATEHDDFAAHTKSEPRHTGYFSSRSANGTSRSQHHYNAQSPSPLRAGFGGLVNTKLHIDIQGEESPTSTITGANTVFYSPHSRSHDIGMVSPTSHVSNSSSFRALRDVTLLDVDNIKNCTSVSDLENVIEVLRGEGKFQALLRIAESRLGTLLLKNSPNQSAAAENPVLVAENLKEAPYESIIPKKPSPIRTNNLHHQTTSIFAAMPASTLERSPPKPPTRPSPRRSPVLAASPEQHVAIQMEPASTTTTAISPRQQAIDNANGLLGDEGTFAFSDPSESSLVMSVSSSVLNGNLEEDQQQMEGVLGNNSHSMRRFDRRRNPNYLSPSPSPVARYDNKKLSDDLRKLTETVLGMETDRAADRKLFLEKLTALEARKDGSDDKMRAIEGMMETSSAHTRELLQCLERLKTDNQELQENARSERNAWRQSYVQVQQLESRLGQKVEQLSQAISKQQPLQQQLSKEQEERIRLQYLTEISKQKKEQEETLGSLLVGMGRNKNELRQMTLEQKGGLVTSFVKKSLSTKAAAEALAQEVAILEKERQEASKAKRALLGQLEKARSTQSQLEHENFELRKKIEQLKEDLQAMRVQVTELSSNRAKKEDWEKREQSYKNTIQALKNQLRKEETMVSVQLYKSAVESGKEKGKQVEAKKAELDAMKAKYTVLESELQHVHNSQVTADDTIRKNQEKSQQRISELKSQLQAERKTKNSLVAAAKQESEKLKEQLDDLRLQMGAANGRTPQARRHAHATTPTQPQAPNLVAAAVVTPRQPPPPPPPPPPPLRTNSNVPPSPSPGQKQAYRSKFSFVKQAGGRKGLQQKVNQIRSPRGQTQKLV
ncbi:expressed unknown protein [Seminavis robusta]|uniref:Uncharacterized protein n=1 Tax=Seminavis robusta TaxID=568900 RepID=A0A9N8H4P9_9STRA|nr:expressed unknown protein [Seminavis robusta]|eukprot:Sro11_g008780.1 n/a (889) ;mRNA; f:153615-156441